MIRIHFTSAQGFIPDGIRYFTDAPLITHAAIEINGWVWEISHDSVVNQRPLQQWMDGYADSYHSSHTLYGLDEDVVRQRLIDQEGMKYDWLIIFSSPLHLKLSMPNRRVCSQMIAIAIQELIYHDWHHTVNPRNLKSIAHANERGYLAGLFNSPTESTEQYQEKQ